MGHTLSRDLKIIIFSGTQMDLTCFSENNFHFSKQGACTQHSKPNRNAYSCAAPVCPWENKHL